jgi:hypothetical protein
MINLIKLQPSLYCLHATEIQCRLTELRIVAFSKVLGHSNSNNNSKMNRQTKGGLVKVPRDCLMIVG